MELYNVLLKKMGIDIPKIDRTMEVKYNQYIENNTMAYVRIAFITGLILYILNIILDINMVTVSFSKIIFIRVIVTITIIVAYFLTYTEFIKRYLQIFLAVCSFLSGAGILSMIAVLNPVEPAFNAYYVGLVIVIMWNFALIQLRVKYAVLAAWLMIIGYNFIAVFLQHLLKDKYVNILINNNMFLISTVIIGTKMGGLIEYYHKKEFLIKEELKEAKERLKYQAYSDNLTGLPNRNLFFEKADIMIKLAERKQCELGLLFIDLDNFKYVNDNFGHLEGDRVLITAAYVINESIRSSDLAARFGGDEFVVMLYDIKNVKNAETIAEKLISEIEKQNINITLSIGISMIKAGQDINSLIAVADKAMYEAKKITGEWLFSIPLLFFYQVKRLI